MRLRLILPLCVVFVAMRGYAAEPAKIELHVIQTTTLTDEQFLTGARDGQPALSQPSCDSQSAAQHAYRPW
jgi:hypothetical protein